MNFNTRQWLPLISTFCLLFINVNGSHAQNSDTYYSVIENREKQYNNYLSNSFNSYFNKSAQINKLEAPPKTDIQNINENESISRISGSLQFQNQGFQNNVDLSWLNSRISNSFPNSYLLSNLTRSRSTLNDVIANTRIAATPIRTVVMPISIVGAAPILNHLWSSPIPNINVRIQYVYQRPIFDMALWNELRSRERGIQFFQGLGVAIFLPTKLAFADPAWSFWEREYKLGFVSLIGEGLRHFAFDTWNKPLEHAQEFINQNNWRAFNPN